ncbi:hypothetical protein [Pseudomonas sp. Q2-TVG4-2]|uniref:hypothetical protein n=1 Tax=Pseudomonas sp. Q2-TVG4-2 TaxID=1685699 RepID=UPI0015E71964|nr:hypothetical protein [Pseudomonas sp. Q2-TVG4-2]
MGRNRQRRAGEPVIGTHLRWRIEQALRRRFGHSGSSIDQPQEGTVNRPSALRQQPQID